MVVKYWGTSHIPNPAYPSLSHSLITILCCVSPYKRIPENDISYSVWIVPGTVDIDGNDVTYGNSD